MRDEAQACAQCIARRLLHRKNTDRHGRGQSTVSPGKSQESYRLTDREAWSIAAAPRGVTSEISVLFTTAIFSMQFDKCRYSPDTSFLSC